MRGALLTAQRLGSIREHSPPRCGCVVAPTRLPLRPHSSFACCPYHSQKTLKQPGDVPEAPVVAELGVKPLNYGPRDVLEGMSNDEALAARKVGGVWVCVGAVVGG